MSASNDSAFAFTRRPKHDPQWMSPAQLACVGLMVAVAGLLTLHVVFMALGEGEPAAGAHALWSPASLTWKMTATVHRSMLHLILPLAVAAGEGQTLPHVLRMPGGLHAPLAASWRAEGASEAPDDPRRLLEEGFPPPFKQALTVSGKPVGTKSIR